MLEREGVRVADGRRELLIGGALESIKIKKEVGEWA